VCEETEIIPQGEQSILVNPDHSLFIKITQYPPVLPQKTMNVPYKIVRITVQPVVVIIPALIGTKFLIGASANYGTTIETFLFHSTNVLIKIQKNVFKRLQMSINGSETGIIT